MVPIMKELLHCHTAVGLLKKSIAFPLMFLFFGTAYSQEFTPPVSFNGQYISIDLSKSLKGNEIHDRLHYLFEYSSNVELSQEILNSLNSIQDNPAYHQKLTSLRAAIFKILENPIVSPEDKKFVCNFYLSQSEIHFESIKPALKSYLSKL